MKKIHLLLMNLKERGITVGDLLILLIIIIATTVVIKSLNKDKKATLNYNNQENFILSKINHKNLSA